MAVAAYSNDLTDIDAAEATTNWAEYTASGWTSIFGGATADTDDFVQNATCISSTVKTGVGGIPADNGSGITLATDEAVLIWAKWDATSALHATTGIRLTMGSSLSVFYGFDQSGSDELPYGMNWINYALGDPDDSEITADYTVGGISSGFTKQFFGWAYNAPTSVPSKGNPYKVDAIRYGRCEIAVIDGQAAAYGTFAGMATHNDLNVTTFRRLGLFQTIAGGYLWKGLMTLGNATAVDFRDASGSVINVDGNTKHVTANFNKIEVNHASSRVDWTGITFNSLSTQSAGRFEMVAAADVNLLNCNFNDMDTFIFQSTGSALGCVWKGCGAVTAAGADLSGSSILTPNITANTSGLIWNVNTDPDGLLDGMTFTKTSGLAHHAIEFGTAIADLADFTLNNCDFGTDFSATEGGTTGDETFHFLDTTGSITLNLVGCTGNFGYRTAGVTVTIVADPVTTAVNITDHLGANLLNCRVLLEASADTGDLPYMENISITRSGTTATVAHTAHGIPDGKKAVIRGATDPLYNGTFVITDTGANSYTYTMSGTPAASPAVGNRISTGQDETDYVASFSGGTGHSVSDVITLDRGTLITVDAVSGGVVTQFTVDSRAAHGGESVGDVRAQTSSDGAGVGFSLTLASANLTCSSSGAHIQGLTDSGGNITDSRTITLDQPLKGVARMSTTTPRYKTFPLSTTCDNVNGVSITAMLSLDE